MEHEADARLTTWFWLDNVVIDEYAERIGPMALALYATLVRHAKKNGEAYPSLRRLQKLMKVSRTTIVKYLEVLETEGLISREKRRSTDGDMTSTMYTILPPGGGPAGEPRGSGDEPQVVQQVNHGGPAGEPEGIVLKEFNPKEDPPLVPPKGKRQQKPKRQVTHFVPESFAVTPTMLTWGAKEFPVVNLEYETQKFRDHEFDKPHSDWPKAWRNWIRFASEHPSRPRASPHTRTQQRDAANIESTLQLEDVISGSNGRQNLRPQPRSVSHGVQRGIGPG